MNNTYPSADFLWALAPYEFNEWRAQNDLPRLFEFLKKVLPSFDQWLSSLPFGLDTALRVVPTGDLLKGEANKVVINKNEIFPPTETFECFEGTAEQAKEQWKFLSNEITVLGGIEPYFKWARRTLRRDRFFVYNERSNQVADGIVYGSWTGLNEDGCLTQANLFGSLRVLKMGQVQIGRETAIGTRNLDFCDLDYLKITSGWHGYGSNWKCINYSSCRHFTFLDAEVAFYIFYRCAMNKFDALNSRLQDVYFKHCDIHELRLTNSFIFRMGFFESEITPYIQNCELREVEFTPKKYAAPTTSAITFRLLRAAYQSCGLRQEASKSYYYERIYERKAYYYSYLSDSKRYRLVRYGARFSVLKNLYERNLVKEHELPREVLGILISKVKLYTLPGYLFPLLWSRIRWLLSFLEYMLWGYGEKPLRIVLVALSLIALYAGIYNAVDWVDETGQIKRLNFWDSLYFSVVTFTTLGYGDITPKTQLLRLLAGSEAVCGAFIIGLFVAGFSNRSRY